MFKPLSEVATPDQRFANQAIPDEEAWCLITLADHHASIAAITLPKDADADVLEMWDRARNVFLYAWFDWELTGVAEMQALATLEAALRAHYGVRKTLNPLVRLAMVDGLFDKAGMGERLPAMLSLYRNNWAHGANSFGTPRLALHMIGLCAELIGLIPPKAAP